jgi:Flp pilus assembly protein TadD
MLPPEVAQQLQSLVQAGQLDRLLVALHEALQRYPQEPDVYHLLGWAATQQRRYEDAITHFRLAAQLKPDAAGTLYNLGVVLLEVDRLGEAVVAF